MVKNIKCYRKKITQEEVTYNLGQSSQGDCRDRSQIEMGGKKVELNRAAFQENLSEGENGANPITTGEDGTEKVLPKR